MNNKHNKCKKLFTKSVLLITLFFLVGNTFVWSLGVRPASSFFDPDHLSKTITVCVQESPAQVMVALSPEISSFISTDTSLLMFDKDMLCLPLSLSLLRNEGGVRQGKLILEQTHFVTSGISSHIRIKHNIEVVLPGSFVEVSVAVNKDKISLENKGSELFEGTLDIISPGGQVVLTQPVSIPSQTGSSVPANNLRGRYNVALRSLTYTHAQDIIIGSPQLSFRPLSSELVSGKINKVVGEIVKDWNSPLSSVTVSGSIGEHSFVFPAFALDKEVTVVEWYVDLRQADLSENTQSLSFDVTFETEFGSSYFSFPVTILGQERALVSSTAPMDVTPIKWIGVGIFIFLILLMFLIGVSKIYTYITFKNEKLLTRDKRWHYGKKR